MSFMRGGSECSTGRNPLSQFTKHTAEDRSLQHDRVAGPSGGRVGGMRSNTGEMSQQDREMMARFGAAGPEQSSFNYEQMRHELHNMGAQGGQIPQVPSQQGAANGGQWARDFGGQQTAPGAAPQDAKNWNAEFQRGGSPAEAMQQQGPGPMQGGMGMGGMPMYGMARPMYSGMSANMAPQFQPQQANARVVELDEQNWEEQFKQMDSAVGKGKEVEEQTAETATATETVTETETTTEDKPMDIKNMDFENIWKNLQVNVLDNMDEWLEETNSPAWERDFHEYTHNRPEFADYQFEENNQFMEHPDPFKIGVELMETGGRLSEAALAFEAAVQKNTEHAEAWGRLGACQAQNEKEDPAIRALERCIKLEPGNLSALMNLSVSYTNEGYENAAYATLERWLATKYPEVVDQARNQEPRLGNEDKFQLHSRVTELFIRAAQLSPDGANIDADVQVGLGVLFYGNEEYDKAIDCFNAAIAVRPDDALLWNRLGATLANSHRSEEAIDAYYKALELRPSFVRARYNLGVSCINIGCYKEAAQYLLGALSMHKVEGVQDDVLANQSTNLYDTLKRVFLGMDRRDLVAKVGNGMDVNQFRNEFEF
ncbi:peroxisomal targeting signal receptor [Yarrowia lipolytica]|jgi:peroxin-5|uniref:Peroxisomal targeting signal receptor n=2 Tax=Yarrowia lipolytica TaxID=4952 RepID=PEX5_YARLI|nr:YALI0F28457p [Yarrowia lipolytica CLIB122]Q99144.1 RecName: Full=Peroxisomal targeting signal receptor; Short=PTS1 receptor; Short=PTS1R; AltName: Full=Peroxin-5; AltName: Full=Peroxisomal protein PAY32 [Yarrowia lipolytica CLIB122]AAA85166.1 Pay32p [Yarrowia lipolytica]AOW07836.1 hypothetical protein YALI1_F36178g [Yarrowia lipolytica]KAB8280531.1 peroxisomal targeting signal receptor [Yarrowia lipolytica]KAE8168871.1 peroxisomal targeting signal receptor [Yarrowia lipolytica]KAJ8055121.1|eukprot:XP_505991.1 YALI0F28457p [Yarrowia lipolytica CLIB122]